MVIHLATVFMCQDDGIKSVFFVDDCMAPSSFAVMLRKNELDQYPVIDRTSLVNYILLLSYYKV